MTLEDAEKARREGLEVYCKNCVGCLMGESTDGRFFFSGDNKGKPVRDWVLPEQISLVSLVGKEE